MKLDELLAKIWSEGYEDIEDYCNQNGLNICDVLDDPDEE